jgi:hypothetical protein
MPLGASAAWEAQQCSISATDSMLYAFVGMPTVGAVCMAPGLWTSAPVQYFVGELFWWDARQVGTALAGLHWVHWVHWGTQRGRAAVCANSMRDRACCVACYVVHGGLALLGTWGLLVSHHHALHVVRCCGGWV